MPVPKQTTELIFSLKALLFRIRQLIKERQGYSKAKHRELAKLLKEGRDDFARIKTEDVIANDNLIAALEIVELYCEQLHVRANILDHLAFSQKRKHVRQKSKTGIKGTGASSSKSDGGGGSGGGGWGIWKLFGYSSNSSHPEGMAHQHKNDTQSLEDTDTGGGQKGASKEDTSTGDIDTSEIYIDPELDQAAAVIFYSYAHIPRDIPGLPEVRAKLALRYGNDFANKVQDDESPVKLPEELVSRLRVQKAPEALVEMYLKEIARSHGIPWHQDAEDEDQVEEGILEPPLERKPQSTDISVVPGLEPKAPAQEESKSQSAAPGGSESNGSGIPEVDELARRFAALKK